MYYVYIIFISIVVVILNTSELWDLLMLYVWSPLGTILVLSGRMKSHWSKGGPRDEIGGYLIFSFVTFLFLLLILSGDIDFNSGPETVKY